MAYIKLSESGEVLQKQGYWEEGFIEAPDWVVCGMVADGEGGYSVRPVPLVARQAAAVVQIDADVDVIYDKVMGRRQAEYERTEHEAREYAEAGYIGTVPPMVQCWAIAKDWNAQAAADDILAVSNAWRTAQEVLRGKRLLRKEQVRTAGGHAALDAVLASWQADLVGMRAQLGIGGV